MKRVTFRENPSDGEVAEVLREYEMQESANPIERLDNWLAPQMPAIERVDAVGWRIFKWVVCCASALFVLWVIKKSF